MEHYRTVSAAATGGGDGRNNCTSFCFLFHVVAATIAATVVGVTTHYQYHRPFRSIRSAAIVMLELILGVYQHDEVVVTVGVLVS